MKMKKIMLVTLVLLAILTIGAVSATEKLTVNETQDSIGLSVNDDSIIAADDGSDVFTENEDSEPDYYIDVPGRYNIEKLDNTLISWNFYDCGENGNLTLYLDGAKLKSYPIESYDSQWISANDLDITQLSEKEYTLNALYSGDTTYSGFNNTYTFTGYIPTLEYTIEVPEEYNIHELGDTLISWEFSEYGEDGNLTIYLDGEELASYNIYDYNYQWLSAEGLGITSLDEKTYRLRFVYTGDSLYEGFDKNYTFEGIIPVIDHRTDVVEEYNIQSPDDTLISIYIGESGKGGNLTIFIDGDEKYSCPVDDEYYYIELSADDLELTNLDYKTYTLRAVHSGDDYYKGFDETYTFTGGWGFKAYLAQYYESEVSYDYVKYGEDVWFIVNPRDATGDVAISVNGKKYKEISAEDLREHLIDDDINVIIPYENFNVGENTVTFKYIGDDYPETVKDVNVTIYPKISLTDRHIDFDESTNITLKMPSDAKGNVDIYEVEINWGPYGDEPEIISSKFIKTVAVKDGTANIEFSNLDLGSHYFQANYTGNDYPVLNLGKFEYDYYSDDPIFNGEVYVSSKINCPSRIYYQNEYNMTVALPQTYNGVLTLTIGSEERSVDIKNGKGSIALFNYESAEKDEWDDYAKLYAYYNIECDTYTANGWQRIEVSTINPSFVLNVTTHEALKGEEYYYFSMKNLPRDIEGEIEIYIDNVYVDSQYIDSTDTIDISNLDFGEHTLKINYLGDEYYLPTSASSKFNVTDVYIYIYDTATIGTYKDHEYGRDICAEIYTVYDAGYYTLTIDGKIIDMDVAEKFNRIDVPELSWGNHEVEITYKNSKIEKTVKGTINAQYTMISDWDQDDIYTNENKTIVLYLPQEISGNVIITVEKNYTVPIVDGVASLTVSNLNEGWHVVYAKYDGNEYPELDEEYVGSFDVFEKNPNQHSGITSDTQYYLKYGDDVIINADFEESKVGKLQVYEYIHKNKVVYATVPLVNGKASAKVSNLEFGEHSIRATLIDLAEEDWFDDDFERSCEVRPIINGTADYLSDAIIFGETPTFTVELPSDANDILYVYEGKTLISQYKLSNGKTTVTLDKYYLSSNNYDIKYNDTKYTIDTELGYLRVYPNITYPEEMVLKSDEYLTMYMPSDATGTLSAFGLEAVMENGVAKIPLSNLSESSHRIDLVYTGDNLYGSFYYYYYDYWYYEKYIYVMKPNSSAFVSKSGENLVVELNNDATGYVVIKAADKFYPALINDGKATLSGINLTDLKEVLLSYTGDEKYAQFRKETFEINETPITPVEANLTINVKDIDEGQTQTITFTINENATGTLDVKVGDKVFTPNIENGSSKVSVENLTVGEYTVTATYSGNRYVLADNKTATFKVNIVKVDADIQITASNIYEGETAVIEIAINPQATGDVKVNVGDKEASAEIKNGTATANINGLTAGEYTITATYAGNDYVQADTKNTTFKVNAAKVSADMEIKAYDIMEGETATISITINEKATGDIAINVADKNYTKAIENGKVSLDVSNLAVGQYTVTATYAGNDYVLADEKTQTFKVSINKVDANLNVKADDIYEGETAVLNIEINPKATGNVLIEIAGTNYTAEIKNGVATASIKDLATGEYTITATYAGNDYVLADTKNTTFKVNAPKVKADIKITADEIFEGSDAVIKVTLNSEATGNVLIEIAVTNYTAEIKNGEASLTVSGLTANTYDITVSYDGNDRVLSEMETAKLTVKPYNPSISAKDVSVQYNKKATFKVTVYTSSGVVAPEGTKVVFKVNGKTFKTTSTNDNGVASIQLSKTPGTYKISVTALGKTVTKKLTVKHIVKLNAVTVKKSAKSLKLKVTLAKLNGKYLNKKTVTVKFNGKTYKPKTNAKGVATVTIPKTVLSKLKVGKSVTYQATYLKDTVKKTAKVKK